MTMGEKKRAAVIGYGGMGGWHAKQISEGGVFELAGISDPKPSQQAIAVERGFRVYESNEAVFADPTVDLVTIATPNQFHEPIAIAAMAAGKHVISEKPVTLSVASLDRMIAASEKYGVRFAVHQNRRWDTDFLAMKEVVTSGALGEIVSYETRVHGSRGIPGDWRKTKVAGGGMVYDWAVHMLDQALWLFGYDVKSVYCTLDNITNDEVDDGCQITVTLTSGVRLYVEIGTRNFIPMPRMYCRGTMGTAISETWQSPVRVTVCEQWTDGGVVVPVKTAAGITKTMAPRGEETVSSYEVPQPAADVHDYYRNFADAIDGKAEQIVTHAQMRRVMEVIEAAFRSAASGQVVYF